MSPFTKFAVLLALAGVLATLFAFFPENRAKIVPLLNSETPPAKANVPSQAIPAKATTGGATAEKNAPGLAPEKKIFSTDVKVPAIRGANNYGWVQLPHGTPVKLVAERGDGLWVRWDDTTVKVPHGAAATGAIVVR